MTSFSVLTTIFVDAPTATDAANLVNQMVLALDADEPHAVYSDTAIITGYEIAQLTACAPSRMYDVDFLPLSPP